MISDDFGVKLYQSIAAENKERIYKHWHASSIYSCPRAHYFQRKGVKELEKPSGAKVIRWGAGHKLEEELRQHVDKVWGGTTSNVRITDLKLDLTGEYDNLTKDGETLIEVKSVSDWAFYTKEGLKQLKKATGRKNKWGKDEFGPKNDPYLHHEYQNYAYVLLLAEQHIDIKYIDYVYASLSGLLCVYHTEVDPEKLAWVQKRIEVLNTFWKAQKLPPCFCDKVDSPLYDLTYRWCGYRQGDTCCSEDLL